MSQDKSNAGSRQRIDQNRDLAAWMTECKARARARQSFADGISESTHGDQIVDPPEG